MANKLKKLMKPILKQKCSEAYQEGYKKGMYIGFKQKKLAYESEIDCLKKIQFALHRSVPKWIPVTERLPDSGVHVLLCCEIRSGGKVYKRYVCDGYYAKRYTEQTWNNSGDIACEYREEDDEYYLLEGWYEVIKNWDDYNSIVIGDFVTHWMPMPEPPKEDEEDGN